MKTEPAVITALVAACRDYSLHAYGPGDRFTFWTGVTRPTAVALDVNSDRNPYSGKGANRLITDMPAGMIAEIEAIRTVSGEQVWECARPRHRHRCGGAVVARCEGRSCPNVD